MPEWLQILLGIIGTVTGTLALVLEGLRYKSDKPKVSIKPGYELSLRGKPYIYLEINNTGNKTTTITRACFAIDKLDGEFYVNSPKRFFSGTADIDLLDGTPQLINPGEFIKVKKDMSHWPLLVNDPDVTLTPLAIDVHGNTVKSNSLPWLRMMLQGGWKPHGMPEGIEVNKPSA